ncbi:hypothetical protein [Variovorax saccharolyticus]|uniref:hypothetical protein n=1 Tax=Variovorax saccharolyticus TaxID=3053516 RepID=UPI00257838FE|nr:hypothetical protein [Variovorax sp. J31P216]MDM0029913.1 hypothetical protein [Variovorax sp. J31P216]
MTNGMTSATRTRLSRTAEAMDEQGFEVTLEERVVEQQISMPDGSIAWRTINTLLLMVGGRSLRPTPMEDVFEAWRSSGELVTVTRWNDI